MVEAVFSQNVKEKLHVPSIIVCAGALLADFSSFGRGGETHNTVPKVLDGTLYQVFMCWIVYNSLHSFLQALKKSSTKD